MTKTELRTYVKNKLKMEGYQSQKSYLYKILDDDYLIGFHLYPSTYVKGYSFVCGIIYLPDELKMPLRGVFDLQWEFRFPLKQGETLNLEEDPDDRRYSYVFEYENYSIDQLEELWEINYEYFIKPLYDKNYGLDVIRKDWNCLKRFAPQNVQKLCVRANMDQKKVFSYLGIDSNN